jgi:hypothetical protein
MMFHALVCMLRATVKNILFSTGLGPGNKLG